MERARTFSICEIEDPKALSVTGPRNVDRLWGCKLMEMARIPGDFPEISRAIKVCLLLDPGRGMGRDE
jgi:hypothetical protein